MESIAEAYARFMVETLRPMFRDELARRDDGWLNSDEAAGYIGTSRAQIHNLVSQGRLPRHGAKGSGLKFRRADLDEYLRTRGRRS